MLQKMSWRINRCMFCIVVLRNSVDKDIVNKPELSPFSEDSALCCSSPETILFIRESDRSSLCILNKWIVYLCLHALEIIAAIEVILNAFFIPTLDQSGCLLLRGKNTRKCVTYKFRDTVLSVVLQEGQLWVTERLRAGRAGFNSWWGQESLFTAGPRPTLGPTNILANRHRIR